MNRDVYRLYFHIKLKEKWPQAKAIRFQKNSVYLVQGIIGKSNDVLFDSQKKKIDHR
jgi:hypothetical protein